MSTAKRKTPRNRPKTGHRTRTSYAKGKSGNPKGRPPLTPEERQDREALVRRARDMSQAVLDRLETLALRGKGPVAVRASELVLDRAWGKPRQDLEVTANGPGVVIMLPPADPE